MSDYCRFCGSAHTSSACSAGFDPTPVAVVTSSADADTPEEAFLKRLHIVAPEVHLPQN